MAARSFGVGSYGNAYVRNQASEDQFNIKTRAALGDPEAQEKLDLNDPDNMSAEQVKAVHEAALRADVKLNTRHESANTFLALHPEFIETDENCNAMSRTLHALFGDIPFTTDHFLKAYEVLNANNSLTLDQAVIVKQKQAEANQRAKVAREKHARENRVFSEAEKENMSLEELRAAENREIQRRMQEAGERGGNDW
jgi:hypothetical protein